MPNAAETVEAPYTAAERLTFLPQPARDINERQHVESLLMGRASLGPSVVRTHSRCEPLAVARHFIAGIGQQLFGLANEFFMQVRLLFENGVDI